MLTIRARRSDGTLALRLSLEEGVALLADQQALVWFDVDEESRDEVVAVGAALALNHLTVEDFTHRRQRGKFEQFDGYAVLVMHAFAYESGVPCLDEHELDLAVGRNWVLTGRDPRLVALDPGPSLDAHVPSMLSTTADYLLYAITDRVVDSMFPVLDEMLDDVDAIEGLIISGDGPALLERIFAMKRNGVVLRKVVAPHLEIFSRLASPAFGVARPEHIIYFRDVHDHLIRVHDIVDSYREMMSAALEVHLSTVNNRLNDVMKRLTVLTAMFLPLTFITGAFGMNMVESPVWSDPAFWVIALGMGGVALGQWLFFRSRGWT